jgi:hypothetical protein
MRRDNPVEGIERYQEQRREMSDCELSRPLLVGPSQISALQIHSLQISDWCSNIHAKLMLDEATFLLSADSSNCTSAIEEDGFCWRIEQQGWDIVAAGDSLDFCKV